MKRLAENSNITDAEVRKVLYGNAAGLFGIDLSALASDIGRVGVDLQAVPEVPASDSQASSLVDVLQLAGT